MRSPVGRPPLLRRLLVSCSFTTQVSLRQSSQLSLRPYQEHCLKACLDAHSSGASRIGVSMPTGAGKTAVFISLLSRLEPRKGNPSATKSLVIVNSIELAKQAAAQARQQRPDWTVEIEQGGKHKASGDADLSVLAMFSVDRLSNLQKEPSRRTKPCSRLGACTSSRRKVSRPW
jgi:ATP-dependent helicase IRC3